MTKDVADVKNIKFTRAPCFLERVTSDNNYIHAAAGNNICKACQSDIRHFI